MSRLWCSSVLGVALAAGCLLPEGSVNDDLPDQEMERLQGGASGSGGNTSVGGGAGAGGGAGSNMTAAAGMGGSGGIPPVVPPTAGAGGGTGGTNMGAAGAGGSGMRTPLADCSGSSTEEACGAYCANYDQSCSDYPAAYTYDSIGDCTMTCNNASWPVGNIVEKGSILCRCYHATLALNNGQPMHCFHAAEVPSMEGGCAP